MSIDITAYEFKVSLDATPFVLNVSYEQLNGICAVAYAVYGDDRGRFVNDVFTQNFRFGPVDEEGIENDDSITEYIADTAFELGDELGQGPLPEREPAQDWIEYVKSIGYSTDDDFEHFTVLLQESSWIIAKFETAQFLQGAIGCCGWLNKDWRTIIKELHYKNTPIDVNSLTITF